MIEAGISALGLILCLVFMQAKPKRPPSLGAKIEKKSVRESLKILKKDTNFILFALGYMIFFGTVTTLGSLSNMIFKPYGFLDIQIAIFAIAIIFAGVPGSMSFACYLKNSKSKYKYKKVITLITVLTLVFEGLVCLLLNAQIHFALQLLLVFSLGFTFIPLIPVSYDLGCELAFPVGEALVTGILNGGAMIFTFMFSIILSSSIGFGTIQASNLIFIIFMSFAFVGTVILAAVKMSGSKLKRK